MYVNCRYDTYVCLTGSSASVCRPAPEPEAERVEPVCRRLKPRPPEQSLQRSRGSNKPTSDMLSSRKESEFIPSGGERSQTVQFGDPALPTDTHE